MDNLQKGRLTTAELNPIVYQCGYFNFYGRLEGAMAARTVNDYEFEYYIRSDGGVIIDGNYVAFTAGDIGVRKPGQIVQGIAPYEGYVLCVDFFGRTEKLSEGLFGSPYYAQPLIDNPLLQKLCNRIPSAFSSALLPYFQQIYTLHPRQTYYDIFCIRTLLCRLLAELFRYPAIPAAAGASNRVKNIVDSLSRRYTEPIDIKALTAEAGCGSAQFHKLFKEYTRCTPLQYVTKLRLEKARQLLTLTDMPIADIAMECGYEDNAYFCRQFRKNMNMTPGSYRMQSRSR